MQAIKSGKFHLSRNSTFMSKTLSWSGTLKCFDDKYLYRTTACRTERRFTARRRQRI